MFGMEMIMGVAAMCMPSLWPDVFNLFERDF